MQRYFVAKNQLDVIEGRAYITGDDVKHITRVLRMAPNDHVIVSDGHGTSCEIELEHFSEQRVEGRIVRILEDLEPKVKITLVQGLPKGDKMEWIVQKGTEVGIHSFMPVETKRSIVKYDEKKRDKFQERLRKIAKEAAEQAHRSTIPDIASPITLRQWVKDSQSFDLLLVPYESETQVSLKQALQNSPTAKTICVLIGPEGGWDEEEIQLLHEYHTTAVTLGPRILRTETAGIVTAAAILYEKDEMGGV